MGSDEWIHVLYVYRSNGAKQDTLLSTTVLYYTIISERYIPFWTTGSINHTDHHSHLLTHHETNHYTNTLHVVRLVQDRFNPRFDEKTGQEVKDDAEKDGNRQSR